MERVAAYQNQWRLFIVKPLSQGILRLLRSILRSPSMRLLSTFQEGKNSPCLAIPDKDPSPSPSPTASRLHQIAHSHHDDPLIFLPDILVSIRLMTVHVNIFAAR